MKYILLILLMTSCREKGIHGRHEKHIKHEKAEFREKHPLEQKEYIESNLTTIEKRFEVISQDKTTKTADNLAFVNGMLINLKTQKDLVEIYANNPKNVKPTKASETSEVAETSIKFNNQINTLNQQITDLITKLSIINSFEALTEVSAQIKLISQTCDKIESDLKNLSKSFAKKVKLNTMKIEIEAIKDCLGKIEISLSTKIGKISQNPNPDAGESYKALEKKVNALSKKVNKA